MIIEERWIRDPERSAEQNVALSSKLSLLFVSVSFSVCSENNVGRYLIINQIIFYIKKIIKKLSLKRNFYEVVYLCFFN
jgi:hypothetical protein